MNNNALSFTALSNEYCVAVANSPSSGTKEFIDNMLRLLPRIYISATDLKPDGLSLTDDSDSWIDQVLSEEEYDHVRSDISVLLGENDVYLEVFEEDMKYSDTPVAASISENLADIYQVLFDFLNTVRFATDEVTDIAIVAVRNSFKEYWSQTLCNVLRALNHISVKGLITEDDEFPDNSGMD